MSIVLALGGIRSGKSAFAERLAEERGGRNVLYLATGQVGDDEMAKRILLHRERRPAEWGTWEEPLALEEAVGGEISHRVVLVDSLSGWVANLLMNRPEEEWRSSGLVRELERRTDLLVDRCRASQADWIFVSDEVGLGGVAMSALGRAFQDAAGLVNQRVAAAADEVYFVAAGIPMPLKGGAVR